MYWNYRFVNMPSVADGEDHITLQEVHYNDDYTIIGVCDPCTFCDTVEELPTLKEHIMLAWDNPVLHESELPEGVVGLGVDDAVDLLKDDERLEWIKDAMANGLCVNT